MSPAPADAAVDAAHTSQRRRVRVLTLLFVVLLSAATWTLSRDAVFMARLVAALPSLRRDNVAGIAALRAAEPPLGAILPSSPAMSRVKRLAGSSRSGCLLVTLGTCSGCTRFDPRPWKEAAVRHNLLLVGVADVGPKAAREQEREMRGLLPVVPDPQAAVSSGLHSIYAGRVYYFDASWRLLWRTEFGQEMAPPRELVRSLERRLEQLR